MFLPWNINVRDGLLPDSTKTVSGISTGIGQLVLVICAVTVLLVQLRWRPGLDRRRFRGRYRSS